MNCPACKRVLVITKPLLPSEDAVVCNHCFTAVPTDKIVWSDGLFHFHIIGTCPDIKIAPRVLMRNQTVTKLDLAKVLKKAIKHISNEPNLRAICSEFSIDDSRIYVELIQEDK